MQAVGESQLRHHICVTDDTTIAHGIGFPQRRMTFGAILANFCVRTDASQRTAAALRVQTPGAEKAAAINERHAADGEQGDDSGDHRHGG